MTSGVITHIQRFSVHDGPGIRTTVFLKGCQMRCAWCHNPETYHMRPELQVFPSRCIGCGACVEACPEAARELLHEARVFHRDRCTASGKCADVCYAKSLVLVGETRTAESVAAAVLADRPFYNPAGGVTISGGEPLVQANFTADILTRCRQAAIHTAVETNLARPWEVVAALLPLVDLFLVDIKTMDDAAHREATGLSNASTLDNLRRLDQRGAALVIRTPVIVGFNAQPEQISAIADFLADFRNVRQYDLLPYHPLGAGKYDSLGLAGPRPQFGTPTVEQLDVLAAAAARPNYVVKVAGTRSATESDSQWASPTEHPAIRYKASCVSRCEPPELESRL
ncbi:MAG: glycyl-radical enzyme activating protein [Patescibacteria group bacterium]|nr:glycyl-radical enzyme activating protein [Patescibacteria group bacterium]